MALAQSLSQASQAYQCKKAETNEGGTKKGTPISQPLEIFLFQITSDEIRAALLKGELVEQGPSLHWRHLCVNYQSSASPARKILSSQQRFQVKVCLTKDCLVTHFLLAAVRPWMFSQVHFPRILPHQAGLRHVPAHSGCFQGEPLGSAAEENLLQVLLVGGRSFPSVTTLGLTSLLCHMEKREAKFAALCNCPLKLCALCAVPASMGAWGHVWSSTPAAHWEFVLSGH